MLLVNYQSLTTHNDVTHSYLKWCSLKNMNNLSNTISSLVSHENGLSCFWSKAAWVIIENFLWSHDNSYDQFLQKNFDHC